MVVQVVDLNIVRGPEGWRTWVIITEFANLALHKCHVDTVKPCSVALDANHIHCVNTTLT